MKKLIAFIVFLIIPAYGFAVSLERPAKSFPSTINQDLTLGGDLTVTGSGSFTGGVTAGGALSRITFSPNLEYIDNAADGFILFQGAGGSNDASFTMDLDDAFPSIYTNTNTLKIADALMIITDTITDPSTSIGIGMSQYFDADTTSSGVLYGTLSSNYLGGSNYGAGTIAIGAQYVNAVNNATGSGGSSNLTAIGLTVIGAKGAGANILTVDDIKGAQIYSAQANSVVGGDANTLILFESDVAVTGTQTVLEIEEPTQGATDYQVVLGGTGAGNGIWFGGTSGQRISAPNTNSIQHGGGLVRAIQTVTDSDLTLDGDEYTVLCEGATATVTITLPASPVTGQIFNIKSIDSTNTVTVAGNGNNIDGSASQTLITDESITIQYDGTEWRIL